MDDRWTDNDEAFRVRMGAPGPLPPGMAELQYRTGHGPQRAWDRLGIVQGCEMVHEGDYVVVTAAGSAAGEYPGNWLGHSGVGSLCRVVRAGIPDDGSAVSMLLARMDGVGDRPIPGTGPAGLFAPVAVSDIRLVKRWPLPKRARDIDDTLTGWWQEWAAMANVSGLSFVGERRSDVRHWLDTVYGLGEQPRHHHIDKASNLMGRRGAAFMIAEDYGGHCTINPDDLIPSKIGGQAVDRGWVVVPVPSAQVIHRVTRGMRP